MSNQESRNHAKYLKQKEFIQGIGHIVIEGQEAELPEPRFLGHLAGSGATRETQPLLKMLPEAEREMIKYSASLFSHIPCSSGCLSLVVGSDKEG